MFNSPSTSDFQPRGARSHIAVTPVDGTDRPLQWIIRVTREPDGHRIGDRFHFGDVLVFDEDAGESTEDDRPLERPYSAVTFAGRGTCDVDGHGRVELFTHHDHDSLRVVVGLDFAETNEGPHGPPRAAIAVARFCTGVFAEPVGEVRAAAAAFELRARAESLFPHLHDETPVDCDQVARILRTTTIELLMSFRTTGADFGESVRARQLSRVASR
ncbi:hypothetical protein N1027_18840 [Herbiconiux sp. CPCC 205763]|uniref:AraC family transcriptional regulator n=1 Tax=Herbiconiux aconitum TaxID=2970913 RepID=A0ABT2GVF9_9MICO|nr:hypothetical protein [Herbiconiux aconitum]MCS5720194.1 hypothetical protein [Herbiconiux aconitum]